MEDALSDVQLKLILRVDPKEQTFTGSLLFGTFGGRRRALVRFIVNCVCWLLKVVGPTDEHIVITWMR